MGSASFDEGEKFRRIAARLKNPEAALKGIGAMMVGESQDAFRNQKFGNKEWRPRAPINVYGIISDFYNGARKPKNRRFQTRPALRDTGRLLQSIAFKVLNSTSVEVGSNLPYADTHQRGGKTESLPINEKVQTALKRWLKGQDKARNDALGFLLSPKKKNKTLKGRVPARPFVGITKQTIEDIETTIKLDIFEVK
tara:strand:+ start:363 stop:950 length:588 start_codon:yes stop_codon:yes gene_type:complete